MEKFTINPNDYLKHNIQAYYHQNYVGFNKPGNPDFLNTLKNQFGKISVELLRDSVSKLKLVLQEDLPLIKVNLENINLTVCVVPRAKTENSYTDNQKLFKRVVSKVVDDLDGFVNGTSYIMRHTNTRTTHMNKSGFGEDGQMPYVGITKETCNISDEVNGKDILLIDDIYTKTINIDEDAIQALLDKGAKNVFFYAVGRTFSGHVVQFIDSDDDLPF